MTGWLRWIQLGGVLLAAVLIGVALYNQWGELRGFDWNLHPGWLALSALLMLGSFLIEVVQWRLMLSSLGGTLPIRASVRIWFLSMIVRYIPGNIWQPLSMTLHCQQWGIRPEVSVLSAVLFQLVTLFSALPICVLYFWVSDNWGPLTGPLTGWTNWLLLLGLLPVLVFIALPRFWIGLLNWGLRRIGRPQLGLTLSSQQLLTFLAIGLVNWGLWGGSFAALAFALGAVGTVSSIPQLGVHLIAIYTVAYTIGFLSLITPSGIGVREGALYVLLLPLLGGGLATVAALAMRLWATLGEFVIAGSAILLTQSLQPAPPITLPASSTIEHGAL